jgi:hypothetical protein
MITHKWQDDGIGKAPFTHTGVIISLPDPNGHPIAYQNGMEEASEIAKGFGVHPGSCDVCGTGLTNNHVIRDADGKHFIVGCDCAVKVGDSSLTTATKEAEKARKLKIKQAKWAAEREKREARILADLEEQRNKNGGLTDQEVADKEREAKRHQYAAENAWIIDTLKSLHYPSGFVSSMVDKLQANPANDLSWRCLEILQDIYGKTAGRRNSKAYLAKCDEFEAKMGWY